MKHLLLVMMLAFGTAQAQDLEEMFRKGEVFFDQGDYKSAKSFYTAVLEYDPTHVNALLQRGLTNSILADYEGAVKDFSKVIETHPEHVFSYISRGSAFNKLKKYDIAMVDFDAAIRLDPTNQEAFNNRGWAKNGLGKSKEACEDWNVSKKMGNVEAKIILKNNQCK